MLKILRYLLSITVLLFASYGLITQDFQYQSLTMLFLSLFILVLGLEEFRKGKSGMGWILMVIFLFGLYVSIEGLVLN